MHGLLRMPRTIANRLFFFAAVSVTVQAIAPACVRVTGCDFESGFAVAKVRKHWGSAPLTVCVRSDACGRHVAS